MHILQVAPPSATLRGEQVEEQAEVQEDPPTGQLLLPQIHAQVGVVQSLSWLATRLLCATPRLHNMHLGFGFSSPPAVISDPAVRYNGSLWLGCR